MSPYGSREIGKRQDLLRATKTLLKTMIVHVVMRNAAHIKRKIIGRWWYLVNNNINCKKTEIKSLARGTFQDARYEMETAISSNYINVTILEVFSFFFFFTDDGKWGTETRRINGLAKSIKMQVIFVGTKKSFEIRRNIKTCYMAVKP